MVCMQMPSTRRYSSDRPRTRAWVKAHNLSLQTTCDLDKLDRARSKRESERGRQRNNRRVRQSSDLSGSIRQGGRRREDTKRHGQHVRNSEIPRQARSQLAVPAWLDSVQTVSPERTLYDQSEESEISSTASPQLEDDMDSSSTSRDTQDDLSTAKANGTKPTKLTDTKLRLRRVQRIASPDDKLPSLRATLKTTLPVRSLDDMPELSAAVEGFIEQIRENRSESCYSFIDEFSLKVDEAKVCMGYPIINPAYFEDQVKKCRAKNEAVLQRTIMMSVFHHYWLGDKFDWNAEGQWSQPKDTRLPSRQDDSVSLPKPDLALSFTLRSFATDEDDSDPAPEDLQRCISPDGGDRCFPFLFMEVKKAAADLQEAEIANLHTASQALYNIFLWMARANMIDTYFDDVRIFSFVFNAQDLSVRVHRACRLSNGNLSFRYDDFLPMSRYTRDQVCLLVDTILKDYAGRELHKILSKAYKEVIAQEDRRVQAKRKASAARDQVSKRARRSTNSNQHTGQSFGMAQL